MKRLLILLVVSLMAVGCSSTPTQEDEVTIYLVRHGKTWFNTTGQVQGFADSPLTEAGIEGAKKAGDALKDIPFTAVYTGDLGRQRNTARIIMEANTKPEVPFYEHVGFQEWNYGGFEGKDNADMWNPLMNEYGYTFDEDWTYYGALYEQLGDKGIADTIASIDPLHEAEDYAAITKRGQEALDMITTNTKSGNVLVVSSGSMIPTLLEIMLPGEYAGESIDNSSVTIVKYKDGKYTIESINDTSHLD